MRAGRSSEAGKLDNYYAGGGSDEIQRQKGKFCPVGQTSSARLPNLELLEEVGKSVILSTVELPHPRLVDRHFFFQLLVVFCVVGSLRFFLSRCASVQYLCP